MPVYNPLRVAPRSFVLGTRPGGLDSITVLRDLTVLALAGSRLYAPIID